MDRTLYLSGEVKLASKDAWELGKRIYEAKGSPTARISGRISNDLEMYLPDEVMPTLSAGPTPFPTL